MNIISFPEWILIAICIASVAAFVLLLAAVVVALLIERAYLGRHVETLLHKLTLVQTDLFIALNEAYRRVEHSNTMVMRLLEVVDQTVGIDRGERGQDEPEWPKVVGDKSDD